MLTQVTMNAGANSINQAWWGLKERTGKEECEGSCRFATYLKVSKGTWFGQIRLYNYMTTAPKYLLTLFLLMLPVFYFCQNLANYTDCCHVNPMGSQLQVPPGNPLFTWMDGYIIHTYGATPILQFGSQLHESGSHHIPFGLGEATVRIA